MVVFSVFPGGKNTKNELVFGIDLEINPICTFAL
jgi:hypothetical protein